MKNHNRQNQIAVFLFVTTLAVFLVFFLYMVNAEQVSVYQLEQHHGYTVLTDIDTEYQEDDTAPAGIRKVYRWTLEPESSAESCLCFNIAHHNIQVYFDDVLMYSLEGAEGNRIGKNVGSNWCSVYAGLEHTGQTVTVVLTPLFEAAISKEPEFLLGSHYAIAMDLLRSELLPMILCALCILLGFFLAAVFLYLRFISRTENLRLFYLGMFSVALGLWKITDLNFTSLLMSDYSMALGYVSVGSLFLTGICLMMYFSTLFREELRSVPLLLSICASLVCLGVLAAQILGHSELRQNLVFSHILVIASMASFPVTALYNRLVHGSTGLLRSWRLLLCLLAGIMVDLVVYYRRNENGTMSFTVLCFVIYSLIVFLGSVQDSTRMAYTDIRTGLVNRTRWNQLMNPDTPLPQPYGILMIDLNGLKHVNDTLGHEAGDQMIFQLSSILRNTLPRTSVICRWGGDEFAVMLPGINREKLNQQVKALSDAADAYNEEHPELPIHFATGAVLSSEHPGISRDDLFRLADDEMYRSKQRWYTQHSS